MGNVRFGLTNLCCLFFGVILAATSLTWAQTRPVVTVTKAIKQAYAPPLSQVAPIPPRADAVGPTEDEVDNRVSLHMVQPTSNVPDPLLQSVPGADVTANLSSLATSPGVNVLGVGTGFPGYSLQAAVPDANLAVGATQVVQFVNQSFAVFNKNGSQAFGPANGNTLWQSLGAPCSTNTQLDEIAQYDKLANVWVLMMPVLATPGYLCVAVSNTSDAVNGGWNLYVFEEQISSSCHCRMSLDYPKLAVWPDGYYISYNQGLSNVFQGAAACVLNRTAMIAGNPATMQCFLNSTGASFGAMLPADVDGTTAPPTGSPEYFASFDYNDQSLDLWQFHVDWTTPANSTFSGPANVPVAAFTEACGETVTEMNYTTGACVAQSGTAQGLDSYGDRLMYRLAYRNFGNSASLLANQTVNAGSGNQTAIRWYELRNSGSGFGLFQQGTYAPDSNYRWMGSIAMDKIGDIALGYNVSGPGMSPSIRYTGRLSTDPLGQMESEFDLLSQRSIANASETNSFHWADYSGMAIDPTDDCTFWYTNEYIPANSNSHWATRVASFSFPACEQTFNYTLTVNEVGQGTVTSTDGQINCSNGSGNCSAVYTGGSAVSMTASPASGWSFSGWSGACSGGNPCNLVVNANVSSTATFSTNWAIVNKASGAANPLNSLTIPTTGAGNVIVIGLAFNQSTKVSSVSDNAGNTYVSAGAHGVKGALSTEIWYVLNSKAGATVVTPSYAGSPTHTEITFWEVAGLAASAPDATNISGGLVTLNNTLGPAVTTSQAGDFVVSVLFASSAKFSGMSSGNTFTDDFTTNGNGWAHLTSNSAAAGTYQPSWFTPLPTGAYAASTVAFVAAN